MATPGTMSPTASDVGLGLPDGMVPAGGMIPTGGIPPPSNSTTDNDMTLLPDGMFSTSLIIGTIK